MGTSLRSRRAQAGAGRVARRRRRHGARGNVDGRAQSDRPPCRDRARARRARHRRCGHLARRPPARCRRAGSIDACYSCTQKCLGAPSGLAPVVFGAARARATGQVPQLLFRSPPARGLLAATEVSPHDVVHAGLRAGRGARDRRGGGHRGAVGASRTQSSRVPRRAERSRPVGASARRRAALDAQRGPRARPDRRGGGAQASARRVQHRDRRRPRTAGRQDLARGPDGRQLGAPSHRPSARCSGERACETGPPRCTRKRWSRIGRWIWGTIAVAFGCVVYGYLTLPDVRPLATTNPATTAFIELRAQEAQSAGQDAASRATLDQLRKNLAGSQARRARRRGRGVLVARRRGLRRAPEVDRARLGARSADARREHHYAAAGEEPLSVAVAQSRAQAARADHRAAARGRTQEGADPRAVSERDRVGRRHLRHRGGVARVFRPLCVDAGADRFGAARGSHHQPARAEPGETNGAAPAAAADHLETHGAVTPPVESAAPVDSLRRPLRRLETPDARRRKLRSSDPLPDSARLTTKSFLHVLDRSA